MARKARRRQAPLAEWDAQEAVYQAEMAAAEAILARECNVAEAILKQDLGGRMRVVWNDFADLTTEHAHPPTTRKEAKRLDTYGDLAYRAYVFADHLLRGKRLLHSERLRNNSATYRASRAALRAFRHARSMAGKCRVPVAVKEAASL
jgi:hypothetical protein